MKRLNLIGQKFGRWTVIKMARKKHNSSCWLCRCECGNEKIVFGSSLTNGKSKSCGCFRTQCLMKHLKSGKAGAKHRMYGTRFYRIWGGTIQRCLNPNNKAYKYYGGRGITVYKQWLEFTNFRDDMYKSYLKHCKRYDEKNTTIDRINNDNNYEPSNCRWATCKEQNCNKRNNKFYTYNGETMILKNWAKKTNINYSTLRARLKYGWSFKKAITILDSFRH